MRARWRRRDRARCEAALAGIYELPLGGTAVGHGPERAARIRRRGDRGDRAPHRPAVRRGAESLRGAGRAATPSCFLSGALRTYAVALTKIANDIRWLGSGPRCGLGELRLPATQPGSSIMPGKVNPVIAESVLMVCAQVIGNDATIAWCARRGQFRAERDDAGDGLRPAGSIELLAAAARNFADGWSTGSRRTGSTSTRWSSSRWPWCTALAPEIGYEKAAERW